MNIVMRDEKDEGVMLFKRGKAFDLKFFFPKLQKVVRFFVCMPHYIVRIFSFGDERPRKIHLSKKTGWRPIFSRLPRFSDYREMWIFLTEWKEEKNFNFNDWCNPIFEMGMCFDYYREKGCERIF